MLLYHPIIDADRYSQVDAMLRSACCEIGFDDQYYCNKYFEQRVVNDCHSPREYTPPRIGIIIVQIILFFCYMHIKEENVKVAIILLLLT